MANEPMSLEGMEDIPDPAAFLAARPPPLEAKAPAERSATRPQRERGRALAVAASLTWTAGSLALWGLRPDLRTPAVVIPLAAWTLLAAGALRIALRPRTRGLPWAPWAVQAALIAVPTGFALSALVGADLREPLLEGSTLPCALAGAQIALVPLALAALTLRRSFLSAPAWRGAAVGAACGLIGAFGIHAHCAYAAGAHVLVAHGLPILLCALLGAAAGALGGRV